MQLEKTKFEQITGEINLSKVSELFSVLNSAKSDNQYEALHLTITSFGGYIVSGLAIYDYLRSYPKPVTVIASGVCHSTALLVLQGASTRMSYPTTQFMFHNPIYEITPEQPLIDLESKVTYYRQLENKYFNKVSEQSKLTSDDLKLKCKSEFYFNADEALDMGFIDNIK